MSCLVNYKKFSLLFFLAKQMSTLNMSFSSEQHPLINNVLPLPRSISGRRIVKSHIEKNLCREYSVTSFLAVNQSNDNDNDVHVRYSLSREIPFELKSSANIVQPRIRQRIETLQRAACHGELPSKRTWPIYC
jgi:hypothetical protein